MKNSTQQYDSSYAGAQKLIFDKESKKKNKASLGRNIIKFVLYILALLFLLWVYNKWQSIPFRKHYFHAESIASADSSRRIRAEFKIMEPKTLDLDNEFMQSWYDHLLVDENSNKEDKELYSYYAVECAFTSLYVHDTNIATPIKPYSLHQYQRNSLDSLSKYIGQPLFDEFYNECVNHNKDLTKYTEVFFYRHLDNEIDIDKTEPQKQKVLIGDAPDCLVNIEKNGFFMCDSAREKALGIRTLGFEKYNEINFNSLARSKYAFKNITEAYLLGPRNASLRAQLKSKISSRFRRFLYNIIKLEDISQTYYMIKMRSSSIPNLYFKMDFVGTIDCYYSEYPYIDHINKYGYPKVKRINVGRSFIEFVRQNNTADSDLFVLVKFNDMQNMQTTRLFILGVLITLTLTRLLGLLWRILSHPLMKLWLKIKNFIRRLFRKKEVVPEKYDQNEDDEIPGFYL